MNELLSSCLLIFNFSDRLRKYKGVAIVTRRVHYNWINFILSFSIFFHLVHFTPELLFKIRCWIVVDDILDVPKSIPVKAKIQCLIIVNRLMGVHRILKIPYSTLACFTNHTITPTHNFWQFSMSGVTFTWNRQKLLFMCQSERTEKIIGAHIMNIACRETLEEFKNLLFFLIQNHFRIHTPPQTLTSYLNLAGAVHCRGSREGERRSDQGTRRKLWNSDL